MPRRFRARKSDTRHALPQVAVSQVPPPAIAGGYPRGLPRGLPPGGSDGGWISFASAAFSRAHAAWRNAARHVGDCPTSVGHGGSVASHTWRSRQNATQNEPPTRIVPITIAARNSERTCHVADARPPSRAHRHAHKSRPRSHTRARPTAAASTAAARTRIARRADGVAERGPAPAKK